MIYLGSDHRGFQLKEAIKTFLIQKEYQVEDLGAFEFNKDDDYPDFASVVAQKVSEKPNENKGILLCGSGHGVDMVANKLKGVRSALGFNRQVAAQSREHEDANVLVLPADWVDELTAKDIVGVWLAKQFDGAERNIRRLGKISVIEKDNFK